MEGSDGWRRLRSATLCRASLRAGALVDRELRFIANNPLEQPRRVRLDGHQSVWIIAVMPRLLPEAPARSCQRKARAEPA
jgi:hypothetical protein